MMNKGKLKNTAQLVNGTVLTRDLVFFPIVTQNTQMNYLILTKTIFIESTRADFN